MQSHWMVWHLRWGRAMRIGAWSLEGQVTLGTEGDAVLAGTSVGLVTEGISPSTAAESLGLQEVLGHQERVMQGGASGG